MSVEVLAIPGGVADIEAVSSRGVDRRL